MKRYTVEDFLLTHGSWQAMIARTVYGSGSYERYKGRGIQVCVRWRSFAAFIEDMGPRPGKEFSLDRFPDKNGHYEPGNCRWATAQQQASNTRSTRLLTFNGETHSASEWERRLGMGRGVLRCRLRQGVSVEEAITTPLAANNPSYKSFAEGRERGKKLDAAQVKEIVALASSGAWTAVALGKRFGVSAGAICQVLKQFGVHLKKGRPKCSR